MSIKHTFGHNIPNADTYISLYHKILYSNKLIEARHFVNYFKDSVFFVNLGQTEIYNIQLTHKSTMSANNLSVETKD